MAADLDKLANLFNALVDYIKSFVKMIFQTNTWLNNVETGIGDSENNTGVYDVNDFDPIDVEVGTTVITLGE